MRGLSVRYREATAFKAVEYSLPDDYVAIAADLPAKVRVKRLKLTDLPANWRNHPAPETLQQIGNEWLRAQNAVALVVPSAIVPQEENWLFNPAHSDFAKLAIHPPSEFQFDSRLWK
jgi:RES domain-containing protein